MAVKVLLIQHLGSLPGIGRVIAQFRHMLGAVFVVMQILDHAHAREQQPQPEFAQYGTHGGSVTQLAVQVTRG